MINQYLERLKDLNLEIEKDHEVNTSPLFGAIKSNIDNATHLLRTVQHLNNILGIKPKHEWQSIMSKMSHYEDIKARNRELEDKLKSVEGRLESIKAALNDNPS